MQLKLDFSKQPTNVFHGKKDEIPPVSFRLEKDFKAELEFVASAKNISLSELLYGYAVDGYLNDKKTILYLQHNGNRPLRDLLK